MAEESLIDSNFSKMRSYIYESDKPFTDEILETLKKYDELEITNPLFDSGFDRIPENITSIIISLGGYSLFNQPIDNLHPNVKTIYLDGEFNQPIDHLPSGLKCLRLSHKFNQKIDNLPTELEELYLYRDFNQSVDNLPLGLKRLRLGDCFNHSLENLPPKLEHFILENAYYTHSLDYLPNTVEIIHLYTDVMSRYFSYNITRLPDNIIRIITSKYYRDTNIWQLMEEHNRIITYPDKKCIYDTVDYYDNSDDYFN